MLAISIITPSLNQAQFIREAIESVLSQNDPCFEHIVVDGGSTDGTIPILQSYPRLKWTSAKDKGQADAFNKGLALATGDIIGEINADDYYLPGAFAVMRRTMSRPNAKDVAVGACEFRRDGQRVMLWQPGPVTLAKALQFPLNPIPHPSLFVRRGLMQRVGGLDVNIRYGPDVDLFLRLAALTDFDYIPEILAVSRIHSKAIQEVEWERNFTAVLYHIARHGDFENFHRLYGETHDGFRKTSSQATAIPLLRELVRAKWRLLGTQTESIAIFGAGNHTAWLEGVIEDIITPRICAVLDDMPQNRPSFFGLPVMDAKEWSNPQKIPVLLSTDTHTEIMHNRCKTLYGHDANLIDLYANLPSGPYRK